MRPVRLSSILLAPPVALVALGALVACTEARQDPPEIARITPAAVCGTGTQTLLVEGNHFDPDAVIDFPLERTNAGIEIADDDQGVLTARRAIVLHDRSAGAPAAGAAPLTYDVRVINPDGSEARLFAGFTSYAPFELASITPNRGPRGTTVALVLRGTGFHGPLSLQIGVEDVARAEDIPTGSTETATTPLMIPVGARAGTYAIVLRNPGGCEVALDRAFTVE